VYQGQLQADRLNDLNDLKTLGKTRLVKFTNSIGGENLLSGTDTFENIAKTHVANSGVCRIKDSIAKNNKY